MTTFLVTITGGVPADVDDITSNLTFVHPDWDVEAVEVPAAAA